MDAQADLSLRLAHMSEGMFSYVAAQIQKKKNNKKTKNNVPLLGELDSCFIIMHRYLFMSVVVVSYVKESIFQEYYIS